MNIDRIYAEHPLNARTILARVERQRITPPLNEWHLAVDPETELTDQNHTGGVQSVLELAAAAGVGAQTTIVDVGAGLGGSARVLASAFGCRVLGVDRDARRCADAAELTRLVHLADRASFVQMDALAGPPPIRGIDVLWGQAAWVHFPDPASFLDVWAPALANGARVATSDSHLRHTSRTAGETRLIGELERSWAANLRTIDVWLRALKAAGFEICHLEERTEDAVATFRKLLRVSSRWPAGTATAFETAGWSQALAAYEGGLIGSFRLVARGRR